MNEAARVESFGVSLREGADAVVLASAATIGAARACDPGAVGACHLVGSPALRGRTGHLEVLRLTD